MALKKDGDRLIIADEEEEEGFMIYLSKVDEFTPIPEDMELSFGGEFNTEIESEDENIEISTD